MQAVLSLVYKSFSLPTHAGVQSCIDRVYIIRSSHLGCCQKNKTVELFKLVPYRLNKAKVMLMMNSNSNTNANNNFDDDNVQVQKQRKRIQIAFKLKKKKGIRNSNVGLKNKTFSAI